LISGVGVGIGEGSASGEGDGDAIFEVLGLTGAGIVMITGGNKSLVFCATNPLGDGDGDGGGVGVTSGVGAVSGV
jgi:hypothetical protein